MIFDITIPVIETIITTCIFILIIYLFDKYQNKYWLSKHPETYCNLRNLK